jgi:hypothetical protein
MTDDEMLDEPLTIEEPEDEVEEAPEMVDEEPAAEATFSPGFVSGAEKRRRTAAVNRKLHETGNFVTYRAKPVVGDPYARIEPEGPFEEQTEPDEKPEAPKTTRKPTTRKKG